MYTVVSVTQCLLIVTVYCGLAIGKQAIYLVANIKRGGEVLAFGGHSLKALILGTSKVLEQVYIL